MNATAPIPAAPSMPLRDHIDQLIKAAAKPLGVKELKTLLAKRNVPVKGTKGFKDIDIERTANDAVADGAAFAHPAANGKPKFWHTAYVTPPTPAELVAKTVREKVAKLTDKQVVTDKQLGKPPENKLTDETAKAFDDTLAELIANGELHRHGEKYGKKVPPPPKLTPAEQVVKTVREKVAALGDESVKPNKNNFGKPAASAAQEVLAAFEATVGQLVAEGKLFVYPGGKYGKKKPPTEPTLEETVRKQVVDKLAGGDGPFTSADLSKPKPRSNETEKQTHADALRGVISELEKAGRLFPHPGGKYGKTPPPKPKWYEAETAKKPFNDLVKNAKKLIEELRAATADEVFSALREKLGSPAPPVAHNPQPPVSQAPASPPPVAPAADLRTVLKQAYDHLCLFVEFRDKLVELPRLYHEAAKRFSGLTVEDFHRELWQMSEERRIQLHVLNEVREAKEPHLAIHRNDRFYYFARWN